MCVQAALPGIMCSLHGEYLNKMYMGHKENSKCSRRLPTQVCICDRCGNSQAQLGSFYRKMSSSSSQKDRMWKEACQRGWRGSRQRPPPVSPTTFLFINGCMCERPPLLISAASYSCTPKEAHINAHTLN